MIDVNIPSEERLDIELQDEFLDIGISSDAGIDVALGDDGPLEADLPVDEIEVEFFEGIIVPGKRLPNYEGEYTVTPKVSEIVLPTKDRSMIDDVTIFQIPYQSVSNPAGGNTVIIGLE